ncbi:MAG: hypothetical protein DHS20C15_04830 [Planctomycetota bacterium]|nr:MAG: hypothetical protein DHS20C15_04830 [Planctomycetota bacterium]
MGLSSAQRLKRQRDFDAVFQRGRKLVHKRLILWMLPRPDAELARLGLSVGKRVGNSPRRTRVKRLLREAWRARRPELPGTVDAVLLARPGQAPEDLAQALDALDELLRRAAQPPRARGERTRRRRPRGAHRPTDEHAAAPTQRSPSASPPADQGRKHPTPARPAPSDPAPDA